MKGMIGQDCFNLSQLRETRLLGGLSLDRGAATLYNEKNGSMVHRLHCCTANSQLIKECFSRATKNRHFLPTPHSGWSISGYAVHHRGQKPWCAQQRCFLWWLIVCFPSVIPKTSLDISLAELRGRALQLPPAL